MVSIFTGPGPLNARVAASMIRSRLRRASLRAPGCRSRSEIEASSQAESIPLLLGSVR
jgi:hypothetical protein